MMITVSKADLHAALAAVSPHTNPKLDAHARVQCYVVGQNLYVQATSGVTSALAIVSVWDADFLASEIHEDSFTLSSSEVKEVLTVFSPGGSADDSEDGLEDPLQIITGQDELTFMDISGLFPGKTYGLKSPSRAEEYLNIPSSIVPARGERLPDRFTLPSKSVKMFAAASQAYGKMLTFEPSFTQRVVLVSCGESFRGVAVISDEEVDERKLKNELNACQQGWLNRLPVAIEMIKPAERAA